MCGWCGASFTAPNGRGPTPRYCRPSHRQRAFEARRGGRGAPATSALHDHDGTLGAALDRLAVAAASPAETTGSDQRSAAAGYRELHKAACAVLAASGRTAPPAITPTTPRPADPTPSPAPVPPPTPRTTTVRPEPVRRTTQPKPWIVVQHHPGSDTTDPDARIVTGHSTARAAQTAARQLGQLWDRHQGTERPRWTFTAAARPDAILPGEELSQQAARQWAQRLQVPVAAHHHVSYQKRPLPGWPHAVAVDRLEGTYRESLNGRWHRDTGGYHLRSHTPRPRDAHPYAANLLFDACELAYLSPVAQCPQLHTVIDDFAADILDPLGDTWTLDADTIRAWLEQRQLITIIPPQ
ncbi:MAG: TetR/AcrR family transcriptional regulator, repressor for neighboring sulfatase [Acidimicrobiaceae bacterium]|nr:TetR/AcrR family transcriptional regulator, repressor for neighboring sulfatase [Acidimicrobiaceae bacterium]